jgi:predicted transcriptional regulator
MLSNYFKLSKQCLLFASLFGASSLTNVTHIYANDEALEEVRTSANTPRSLQEEADAIAKEKKELLEEKEKLQLLAKDLRKNSNISKEAFSQQKKYLQGQAKILKDRKKKLDKRVKALEKERSQINPTEKVSKRAAEKIDANNQEWNDRRTVNIEAINKRKAKKAQNQTITKKNDIDPPSQPTHAPKIKQQKLIATPNAELKLQDNAIKLAKMPWNPLRRHVGQSAGEQSSINQDAWAETYLSKQISKLSTERDQYTTDNFGATVGYDISLTDKASIGLYYDYSNYKTSYLTETSQVTDTTNQGGLSFNYSLSDKLGTNLGVSYAVDDVLDNSGKSTSKMNQLGFFGGFNTSMNFANSGVYLIPSFILDYTNSYYPDTNDKGTYQVTASFGGDISKDFAVNDSFITPSISATLIQTLVQTTDSTKILRDRPALGVSPYSYTTFTIGTSLNFSNDLFSSNASYSFDVNSSSYSHFGSIQLRVNL